MAEVAVSSGPLIALNSSVIQFLLRFIFLIGFIVTGAFASDELPQPLIIATTSQSETSQQLDHLESVTVEVNDLVSHAELPPENPANKKSRYLKILESLRDRAPQKVRSIFTKLNLSKEFQEFVISDLEDKLAHAPDLIMTSNASGYGIRPSVLAGFGVSDYILEQIKKKSWGKLVPPFAHFGLGFGIGFGYLSYVRHNRRHLIFRVDVNAEHTLSMINWMGEAFAGVSIQKMSEQLSDEFMDNNRMIQHFYSKLERSNIGPAGTMISQDGYFEHAYSGGLSFPPIVGMTSFYKFRIHQLGLNFKVDIQGLVNLKNKIIRSCRISVKSP